MEFYWSRYLLYGILGGALQNKKVSTMVGSYSSITIAVIKEK